MFQEFPTCSVRKFIMGTEQPLGQLTYLSVWHDNSGVGIYKSWYFHKAIIQDLQTNQRYIFMCDQWLALDHGDGLVERTVPVYASTEDSGFGTMFSEHARYNVTENHLWLSMFMRPERSNFTRVQRLTCIVSMLFLAMITNAMFFEGSSTNTEQSAVNMGSMRLSLRTIYVSAISIIITTIPVALVGIIFRKIRPKATKTQHRQKMYMEQIKVNHPDLRHLTDRKNKKCMLPHWMIFVAWIIVVLSILASGFFLILYSMEWGKSVSEEWLCSFVLSFSESLLFVDPFKVKFAFFYVQEYFLMLLLWHKILDNRVNKNVLDVNYTCDK
ncbi:hypothetical protein KUTeg_003086 [Tegillarca granosa]|uniref:PLAT domain-containing protein n=1 Tax=Tegillarca granosa TaxID=220873 RepID=A0ABQ9FP10_TEGGR|nr:hypothetical protein KUTeg_003086 [Tegillarca granosa]